jgi:hypothetical protein
MKVFAFDVLGKNCPKRTLPTAFFVPGFRSSQPDLQNTCLYLFAKNAKTDNLQRRNHIKKVFF